MKAFKIPPTGLTVGVDKLRDGYVIVGSYRIDEHHKEVLKARRYEVSTAGVFVCPDSPVEVGTYSVTCGRRKCTVPRCAEEEARDISSTLTHVFRATGNAVLEVTVPRLANAAEFEAALWAVIDAGSVIASHDGVESVYGLVAVPEWHLEGRCADRADEVIRKGAAFFRNSFPYHQHATISLTLADDAPVEVIEAAFTEALRSRVDESIYRGSLEWNDAAVDIAEIKTKGLEDSVPVGLLKPLGTLGNSDWYKLDYITKNLDARTHSMYGGVYGAWGVERQRAICDELLVPGDSKKRSTPLRGVKLNNYGWFNAYAYPQNGGLEVRFMSQGNTGWTRQALEQDVTRRRKGFEVEPDRFYDPATGWLEEVTHKGVTLSEVITSTVIDADLTVTAAEALKRARAEVRARLMAECEAESARIEANYAQLRAIKADRHMRFTKAVYAALSAILSVLAQERAKSLQELLRVLVAPLGIEKAAHMPRRVASFTLGVQPQAQKARAPPRHTCRPPVILPSIKDLDLLLNNFY